MSNAYSVPLVDRKEIAIGTMAFFFERPKEFIFKAGQYLDLTLKNPPYTDDLGNVRTFSIASSPNEPRIMVAMRMRNTALKNSLREVPFGTKVELQGPMGSFTLHKDAARPAVLLAGGIGITPFRSMVKYAAEEKLSHRIFLFYSNRRPEDAAFLEELMAFQEENPNYTCIPTMTEMTARLGSLQEDALTPGLARMSWSGLTNYIDAEMIQGHARNLENAIYYTAGPPAMVTAMRHILDAMNIDDDTIKTEEFGGY
ncbi:MAG: FAD-dependent oxidoreductase [bacterium]|nr:FAD-dependent oxidoreductase [bacterium]